MLEFKGEPVRNARHAIILTILLPLLLACASKTQTVKSPDDPFEPVNRAVFGMNRTLDMIFIKPAAVAYRMVLPSPVRAGV